MVNRINETIFNVALLHFTISKSGNYKVRSYNRLTIRVIVLQTECVKKYQLSWRFLKVWFCAGDYHYVHTAGKVLKLKSLYLFILPICDPYQIFMTV